MKVYLIHPKAPPSLESLSEGLAWWGVDANHAPLPLAILAALTPGDVELKLSDQQAGDAIQYEENADVVVLVAEAAQIPGIRYLAGRFRARRIPVAVAGSYVSSFPDRVDSGDIKLIGDLEAVYPALLADLAAGRKPRKEYRADAGEPPAGLASPRWDGIPLPRYRLAPLEVSRTAPGAGNGGAHGAASAQAAARGAASTDAAVNGPSRRFKPLSQLLEDLQLLQSHGANRIWLETDDLVADPEQARALLEALAEHNARLRPRLRFETRVGLSIVRHPELVKLLGRVNVRRVELELNPEEVAGPHVHEDPREAIEAVRVLHERGIRVVGRLTVFREGDDGQSWDAQVAVARESNALPWIRAARALPGTALFERLKAAGRIVQGGRDAELRLELFEPPNFQPALGSRENQGTQLRALVLDLYACVRLEQRLRGLYREAKEGPSGAIWPARDDLRALARMLAGTFQAPGEQRLRLAGRAVVATATERPSIAVWSQGLEQLLEEAAARSFVVKTAEGRPLDATAPSFSWKQRAVGLGAKAMSLFASRRM